jgi:CrcB protein
MLKELFWVGLGGGIGSILRYLTSKLASWKIGTVNFPLATFIVNIAGCFLIGLLIGLSLKNQVLSTNMKLLLITGFCGGFTTFSTFSSENLQMYEAGNYGTLAVYILGSIILGLLAVWGGMMIIDSGI